MNKCVICNEELTRIATLTRRGPFGLYGYIKCHNCDTFQLTEPIAPNDIVTYNYDYILRNTPEAQQIRFNKMSELVRPNDILDFGCGYQEFLSFLKSKNLNAYGVDIYTNNKIQNFLDNSLDVVSLIEVISHLTDPNDVMEEANRVLKPGGIVYIESTFVDDMHNYAKNEYIDPSLGHCTILSHKALRILADNCNLEFNKLDDNTFALRKL